MKNNLKTLSLLTLLLYGCLVAESQNLLPLQWKFQTGDDPAWSKPAFDDSGWIPIAPDRPWEQQGFASYDGYAWYRVTFNIPSSYKKLLGKENAFLLKLGMIDDADITWFNGKVAGSTGTFPPAYVTAYNQERNYTIPGKLIRWDKPNTIAIRVFDEIGGGGIYTGMPVLVIKELYDNIQLTPVFKQSDHIVTGTDNFSLPVEVTNASATEIAGSLSLEVFDVVGQSVKAFHKEVTIPSGVNKSFNLDMQSVQPGFYKAKLKLEAGLFVKQQLVQFGFEPEKIQRPTDHQPDFDSFWENAKAELRQVDPRYQILKVDSLCTDSRNVFLIEMHSLGDVLIRGWYSVPASPGKYPAILQVQGYSSTIIPPYVDYGNDIIGFGLNIRGHGNSKDDVNPGFPGYLQYHLEDRDQYIYRGAYMDCVRAVDFLCTRQEVDQQRICVEGGSQGGALTFATAALANDRIAFCAPQVPFLSDFPMYFKVANWPANEFVNYVEVEKKQSWEEVYRTLSYFDIKNLAPMIKAPMLMAVGLRDDVCPPVINFAAFNNVPGEKYYVIYPEAGHGIPQDFYLRKMKWFREKLGLPAMENIH